MISLDNLRIHCLVSLLIVFFATTLGATELPSHPENSAAQEYQSGKDTALEVFAGITNEYLVGHADDFKSSVTVPELWSTVDISSPAEENNHFKQKITIPLYKDSEKNRWGLAAMRDSFSLNPITDIRNLGVILQHRF